MRTEQRLTEAYNNARIEYFDENSKIVFFSDCHRGTGGLADEFIKNQNTYLHALDYYYDKGFAYIEAGDGDELWEHKTFKHIRMAHKLEFEKIKKFHDENRFILMYGNHNIILKDPKFVEQNLNYVYSEFQQKTRCFLKGIVPCEAVVLINRKNGQEFLVVHGHQGDFANDQLWKFTMFTSKYFWRFLHSLGATNPSSPVKNLHKQHRIEKNFSKWIQKNSTPIICGHTHRFKFPRHNETPYFNIGCGVYPASITAIEIENGSIQLVSWRIIPNAEGTLVVVKNVLRGPEPIEKFDMR